MKMTNKTPDDGPVRDCSTAMDRLFDLLDGELTPERERELRLHITGCPDCFTHADFEQRFLAAVAAAKMSASAPDALRARVMDALRTAGLSGAAKQ